MQSVIIIDNEYITLRYLPDKKIIHHTIHKPFDSEVGSEAMVAGVAVLKEHGACKWLSDDRQNGPLSLDMINSSVVWGPAMVAAGWKYWANVVPQEIAAAATLAPVIEALYGFGLRMMVFTDVEEALQWLDKMEC
ncbi:MAG TPA: hypothetical protein VHP83_07580 [Aggregatilineaceae bacterium]|nr:hypothetical protein [Aggregatilineaceae bacterium]